MINQIGNRDINNAFYKITFTKALRFVHVLCNLFISYSEEQNCQKMLQHDFGFELYSYSYNFKLNLSIGMRINKTQFSVSMKIQ